MEADISGSQRKVVMVDIRPLKRAHGDAGIPVREGKTLPYRVSRFYSAPAGYYHEQWFLVHPESREVLYASPQSTTSLFGLQAPTEVVAEVYDPLPLQPGTYLVVFSLSGLHAGEVEVEAAELPAEEAA